MNNIRNNAKKECIYLNGKAINPLHLLIACLREKTGAMGELYLKCECSIEQLREAAIHLDRITNENVVMITAFDCPVLESIEKVIESAIAIMRRYQQSFLNEGHLLKALLALRSLDNYITRNDQELILNLGTTARDMITHLRNYQFPIEETNCIRKVTTNYKENLIQFVEEHFSSEWSDTIREGFHMKEPTIYKALDDVGEIIGFAAFDVYQKKKGYFGPMGVKDITRSQGIGFSLLHHCLRDMKEIGYEYAIIGGAGPIEFYEKACQAVVIPIYQ